MPTANMGLIHPRMFAELLPNFYPSLLTIQSATETRSPSGAIIRGWADITGIVDLPCRIAPISGSEIRTQAQILTQALQTCDVPMELLGVTTSHRAIVDGDVYDVTSVDYDAQQLPGNHRRSTRLTLKVVD